MKLPRNLRATDFYSIMFSYKYRFVTLGIELLEYCYGLARYLISCRFDSLSFREDPDQVCPHDRNPIPEDGGVSALIIFMST